MAPDQYAQYASTYHQWDGGMAGQPIVVIAASASGSLWSELRTQDTQLQSNYIEILADTLSVAMRVEIFT